MKESLRSRFICKNIFENQIKRSQHVHTRVRISLTNCGTAELRSGRMARSDLSGKTLAASDWAGERMQEGRHTSFGDIMRLRTCLPSEDCLIRWFSCNYFTWFWNGNAGAVGKFAPTRIPSPPIKLTFESNWLCDVASLIVEKRWRWEREKSGRAGRRRGKPAGRLWSCESVDVWLLGQRRNALTD